MPRRFLALSRPTRGSAVSGECKAVFMLRDDPGDPAAEGRDPSLNHDTTERGSAAPRNEPGSPTSTRKPRPTEDEELLNRPMPTLPNPRAPELAAFTHAEPWRVLRIQGEFVYGINALAEVGAAKPASPSSPAADRA
jgi:hypothetical protein